MKKWLKLIIFIVLLIIVMVLGLTAYQQTKNVSGIPKDILKKTAFKVFTHDPSDQNWAINSSLTTYDKSQGVLTLHFSSKNNELTVNEQVTPDAFTDIPNYSTILLSKLHEFSEIQTSIGTVGLTHPEELNGGQTAVVNSGGTLMFVHPEKDLTDVQWKQFFNSLIVLK